MGIEYNPFSLEGKTILITGASSGIGQATAIECSKMGANLIICGRNIDRLQETKKLLNGENHSIFEGDLTDYEVINNLVSNCPQLDGIVLNAGKGMTLPFQFASREKFDEIFNINFFAPIEILRLLSKKKKINKDSSVVFIVSIGGTYKFSIGNSIYGASKAALKSMINFCAIELASKQIRVNGICPGMVETPLIHRGTLTEEQLKVDMDRYPLKRYGTPKEIALGAIYLLSDASSWTTGQSIIIDGGLTSK